jgi:hypothetical protein
MKQAFNLLAVVISLMTLLYVTCSFNQLLYEIKFVEESLAAYSNSKIGPFEGAHFRQGKTYGRGISFLLSFSILFLV